MHYRKTISLAVILIASASPASAEKYGVSFSPTNDQQVRMVDGISAIDSSFGSSGVRIVAPQEPIKKRGAIQIIFFNKSETPFNVGSENVTASLDDGTSVPIISPEQLAKEERHRQMWAAVAAGLGAAGNSMSAANAGWTHGSGTYSSYTNSSIGSFQTNGVASFSSYNSGQAAAAQSLANIENQRMYDRLAASNSSGKEALKQYLRTTTVDSGDLKGGLVTFELPSIARKSKVPVNVTFLVKSGTEEHKIKAQFVPAK